MDSSNGPEGYQRLSRRSHIALDLLRFILPLLTPILCNLCTGFCQGYSAVALPKLKDEFGADLIDVHVESWIGSLLVAGLMLGTATGGLVSHWLGRRLSNLIVSPVISVGWVLIILTSKHEIYLCYLGRFFTGFGTGFYIPINLVYVASISSPSSRGVATSLCPLFTCLGITLAYVTGMALDWRETAVVGGILPILVMASVPIMKPDRLQSKEFSSSSTSSSASTDMESLSPEKERLSDCNEKDAANAEHIDEAKGVVKPVFLLLTLFLLQSFTGANAVSFYALNILKEFLESLNLTNLGLVMTGLSFVFGYLLSSCFLINRLPRKVLLIASSAIMAISTSTVAIMHLLELSSMLRGIVSLIALAIFILAYSFGFGPIPFIYVGEFFPDHLENILSGIVTGIFCIFNFVSLKTFPYLLAYLGLHGSFFLASGVCITGVIFTFVFIPETKDLTKQEIAQEFSKNCHIPIRRRASERTANLCVPENVFE